MLTSVLLNRFPQKLPVSLTDFYKTETHSRQDIPVRSAVEIGPKEFAHNFDFFPGRLYEQAVGLIQTQLFHAMNKHPLDRNVPRLPFN